MNCEGSWFKGRDLMAEYLEATRTGGDVDASDSFTINGWTGRLDLPNCTDGMFIVYTN